MNQTCTTAGGLTLSLVTFFIMSDSTNESALRPIMVLQSSAKQLTKGAATGSIQRVVYHQESDDVDDSLVTSKEMLSKVLASLGLGITDLAEVLGVERVTLYNWLKGGDVKSPEKIEQLKKLFIIARKINEPVPTFGRLSKSYLLDGQSYAEFLKAGQLDDEKISQYIGKLTKVISLRAAKSKNASTDVQLSGIDEMPGGWKLV